MPRKDDKGDQPSGRETTLTNTGATLYGRGHHKTGSFGDDMLRPSLNHGTQRLPNDDDDDDDEMICESLNARSRPRGKKVTYIRHNKYFCYLSRVCIFRLVAKFHMHLASFFGPTG